MAQKSNTTMDLRKKRDDLKDNNIIKCCFIKLSEDILYRKIFNNHFAYDLQGYCLKDGCASLRVYKVDALHALKDGYANFYNDLINDYDKQEVDRQLAEILKDEKIDI